jgi:hypothetical protein
LIYSPIEGMIAINHSYSWTDTINIMWQDFQNFLAPALLSCTLLGFTLGRGAEALKHGYLRIILTCHYGIPWNLARFLTYCHERRLLQQIGGRYRFIHRELLDHFAAMEE